MPKVTDEHRTAMRERIQQSAIEVVQSKGLAHVTMADIITASGLSAGAIYGYYKGKDELVVDVARSVMSGRRDVLSELTTRSPVPPPSEMLTELISSIPRDWLEGGLILQFWSLALSREPLLREVETLAGSLLQAIDAYLRAWGREQGLDAAAARQRSAELRPALAGLTQGYILQSSLGTGVTVEAYAAAARQVLEGALAAGHPHARLTSAADS